MGNTTPTTLPPFSAEFHRSSFPPSMDRLEKRAIEQNKAILVLIERDADKTETQLKIKTSNKEYYEMLIKQGAGVYIWRPVEE